MIGRVKKHNFFGGGRYEKVYSGSHSYFHPGRPGLCHGVDVRGRRRRRKQLAREQRGFPEYRQQKHRE
jgi:hypothetical protein